MLYEQPEVSYWMALRRFNEVCALGLLSNFGDADSDREW